MTMVRHCRYAFLPVALLCVASLPAQVAVHLLGMDRGTDIAVRGTRMDGTDTTLFLEAVWSGVDGAAPTFSVHHGAPPAAGDALMLDRLVEAGLAAYLDTRVRFGRDGVRCDLPPEQVVFELDAMVTAACETHGAGTLFPGFSDATIAQLGRLLRLDWSRMTRPVDGTGDADKYLAVYRYVRAQRDELERSVRADLLPLAGVPVTGEVPSAGAPRPQVQINSTCGTVFDEENFLCALDLRLADAGPGGVDPQPDPALFQWIDKRAAAPTTPPTVAAAPTPVKVRKRDRWLKAELDAIHDRIGAVDQRKELWALRDRMDDLEDRLTNIDMELRTIKAAQEERADNPIANLSDLTGRNVTVHFDRNGVELDAAARVLLNEIFEQMARSPQDRVLITGHSDRSGDPAVNLRLSERRAKAVRNYLLMRGIAAERLLVNFYGDSRSSGPDPRERRVEVEWLR
jgi:outer membrane protein OmpA-like peptidoglycan-associated protein